MSEPARSPVGFVGLGVMGLPMARRLVDCGEELVVWTRTRAKAQAIVDLGARVADDPADVARACPVVLGCLLDDAAIEAVYFGVDGLLAGARPGALFVEHGTFTPSLAHKLAESAEARGGSFLDAPVTGGAGGAAAGSLVAMTGGADESVKRLVPIASAYCTHVERVGPPGAGVTLKLVNQMLVAAHALAAVEAAALVRGAGIPVDIADRVLNAGWASSTMLARNLTPAVTGRHPAPTATIGALADVLSLVHDLARSLSVPTVLEPAVYGHFMAASRAGMGELDISALPLKPTAS
jgi:3-hydroxyisobutyrate dehydrogenase-like beta-hydroxyacid dehydrogenase